MKASKESKAKSAVFTSEVRIKWVGENVVLNKGKRP